MALVTDYSSQVYTPIIKMRGFNPKPVAGNIPIYADSVGNPKCIGTPNWEEFWLEQIYYCLNGYDTGGLHIPGRYYHFLNFMPLKGLQGTIYPDFVDLHYQMWTLVEEVKKYHKAGGLFPKARRKGVSIFGNGLAGHGARFIPDYRMGVAGGLERYVKGFRIKLYAAFNNTAPEFKMNILKGNDAEYKIGWSEKNELGDFEEKMIAYLQFATMNEQATKFEGEYFHDVICEEAGQFELLLEAHESIRPALELGERMIGTFWIYGTGGNMQKGSKAFKDMWHNYESYNMVRFFIPGNRYFFPYYAGAREEDGSSAEKIAGVKEQFPNLHPEQYIGCEDPEAAKEVILKERIRRAANPDKKVLIDWNKKYPLNVEEVFTSSGSNNFNTDLLYTQLYRVQEASLRYKEFVLEFEKDKDGNIKLPLKVNSFPKSKKHKEWEAVSILDGGHPLVNIKNLDIVGVDGYNEDITTTTSSLGGIVVVRRYDTFNNSVYPGKRLPVLYYMKRPPRKEQFMELALKVAVYYHALKNTMISAESDLVIDYFKKNSGRKYLSPRPKTFDAPDSKQLHDFGVKMTTYSKPRMLGLLQTYVEDNYDVVFFMELLSGLIAYDQENIGSDWDDVDALGYALMRIVDMKRTPEKEEDEQRATSYDLPAYEYEQGTLIDVTNRQRIDPDDPQAHLWIGEKYISDTKEIISDLD